VSAFLPLPRTRGRRAACFADSRLGRAVGQVVEIDFDLPTTGADAEKTKAVEHGGIRVLAGLQVEDTGFGPKRDANLAVTVVGCRIVNQRPFIRAYLGAQRIADGMEQGDVME
jgi:hypothetical protein